MGADADLVIYDPTATATRSAKTHFSLCDRSIFEGFKVKGRPTRVIANGKVRFCDGKLQVERGAGRFVARKPTPRVSPGAQQPAAVRA